MKEIDPALQAEWEKVYHRKWKQRAIIAADIYSGINHFFEMDYYTSTINDIYSGKVPPFWTCCDPNLDAYRAEEDKTGSKVDRIAVINCSVPQTIKECEGRWGMLSNEHIVRALNEGHRNKDNTFSMYKKRWWVGAPGEVHFVLVKENGMTRARLLDNKNKEG